MTNAPETYPPCRCGREMVLLNAASDDPKCPCGMVSDECRCTDWYVLYPPKPLGEGVSRVVGHV